MKPRWNIRTNTECVSKYRVTYLVYNLTGKFGEWNLTNIYHVTFGKILKDKVCE